MIHDFFERRYASVVHVRRRELDVPQSRDTKLTLVGGLVRKCEKPFTSRRICAIRSEVVQAGVTKIHGRMFRSGTLVRRREIDSAMAMVTFEPFREKQIHATKSCGGH